MMQIYDFIKIEQTSGIPIYQQLICGIEKFCTAAEEGDPIPPERELCEELKISRTILRQALKECVSRGLLVKHWGRGNFVGPKERQKRILVITSSDAGMADPFQYILPGIEARAKERSIKLEILQLQFIYDKSEKFVTKMLEREKFTGILFLNYICGLEPPATEAFRKTRTPLYWPHVLENWARKERFYCGCVDTRKTFREALQILANHGAKRIVTISQPEIFSKQFEYGKIRGYTEAEFLKLEQEIGIDPDPELLLDCKNEKQVIYHALDNLIAEKKSFDSILCTSDFHAIHAMSWLKERKFRIPEDVALMGYCGYPGGKFLDPPLSTIDYQYYQIGYSAVDRLLEIAARPFTELPQGGVIDFTPCIARLRGSIKTNRHTEEKRYEIGVFSGDGLTHTKSPKKVLRSVPASSLTGT